MPLLKKFFIPIILCLFIHPASSGLARAEFSKDFYLVGESAAFEKDRSSQTQDYIASLILGTNVEIRNESFSYRGKAAYRFDSFDAKRDLFFISENVVSYEDQEGKHLLSLGHQRIQIGALDIFQSIDLINDVVMDSFVPEIQRRGTLSFGYRYTLDDYKFDLFYLPYFEDPYYPPNSSRMGYGFQYDKEVIVSRSGHEERAGLRSDQFGIKIGASFEMVDITFGHFRMIDRSLTFAGIDENNNINRYFFATDFSFFTFQKVIEESLVKGNFYHKGYADSGVEVQDIISSSSLFLFPKDHSMVSLGFETKADVLSGQDTTLLLEAQKLLGLNQKTASRYSVFNNNLGWGFRHGLNDVKGKQITFFNIVNLADVREHIYLLDYRQMVTETMKFSVGLRVVSSREKAENFSFDSIAGLTLLDDSDCLYFTLSKYF